MPTSPSSSWSTPQHPPAPPTAGVRTAAPGSTVGRVIEVIVTAVHDAEIEVKLADGRIGVIARSEYRDRPAPTVGSTIDAAVLAREDPRERVALSNSWATKLRHWERVEAAKASGEPLTGTVERTIKGGLLVDLGLRAFLPSSMIGEHGPQDPEAMEPEKLVGTEVTVIVTELDRALDRVVVSRRDHLRRQRRQVERYVFSRVKVGDVVTGRVTQLLDYGAYIDIDGVRALLHRSEVSWGRVSKVSQYLSVGDEIETEVIEVQKSKRRIGLSLRRRQPDPYASLEIGSVHHATVTRLVDYGVFAQLNDGEIVGLVHLSELSELPGYRPDELVTPGEAIVVKVLSVDLDKRRIALSVRQATVATPPPATPG